ncbi:MAG: MotA/TolQ/ExbB proton channel family protein [Chitinophagales bacterium]|nr:MotA/TolQ/ExbB proton channel family protein [Bacteroidota bacterium]MCB9044074.1 MotA/TolQ/ExbB proton channel family protein [Chitinophagales bacterium]
MNIILLQSTIDSIGLATQPQSLSLWDLFLKGGWFMYPILLLSIIAVYLFIDRYIAIRKASVVRDEFLRNVRDYMKAGNISAATALCQSENSPISRMIEKGLRRIGKPLEHIKMSVENVGQLEVASLENRVSLLATIAGVAPMLGFLGTVTGMIRAFFNIASAGNNIEPSLLAGGIYEAMLTTAAGLIVGIPAYIAFNILVSMLDKLIFKMEAATVAFLDFLQEPA